MSLGYTSKYSAFRECLLVTGGRASAASEIDVGSIWPTNKELCAAAAKQADTCVAPVALSGMWRVERVSPYVGIHIGGIGWKYGGPLIAKNTQIQLKVTQRTRLVGAPVLIRLKQVQCVLDQWQGSWGAFSLDFSITCFSPQTDKVYVTVFSRCPYFFVDVPLAVFVYFW